MHEVQGKEIYLLQGYLKALETFLRNADYGVELEVKGYDIEDAEFDVAKILKAACPELYEEANTIIQCSRDEMLGSVADCLKLPFTIADQTWLGAELEHDILAGYWQHLKSCITYESSTIFKYSTEPNLNVIWSFHFLIYNQYQKRCVVIRGGADD